MQIVGRGLVLLLTVVTFIAAGQQGFMSLKLGPGVRETGMGGAGCAVAAGPQAMAWNPAATATLTGFLATAGHTKWLLDTRQQSIFIARRLGPVVLGTGVSSFAAGCFEYREEVPQEEPLAVFEPTELSCYLNVSHQLGGGDNTLTGALGANLRYFYTAVATSNASGWGLDIGARLRPVPRLKLGASLVDFGQTLSFYRDRIWLPTRARFGIGYDASVAGRRLTASADMSYFVYSRNTCLQSGVELELIPILNIRTGYELTTLAGSSSAENRPKTVGNAAFGIGLHIGKANGAAPKGLPFGLLVDYAVVPLQYNLGTTHRISVGLSL